MRFGLNTATLIATCTPSESERQQATDLYLGGFSLLENSVATGAEFQLNYDVSFEHTEPPPSVSIASLFSMPEPLSLLFVGLGLIIIGLLRKLMR